MIRRNNLVRSVILCLLWIHSCFSIDASDSSKESGMKTEANEVAGAKMMESVFGDQNATMQMFDKSGNKELYFNDFTELCKHLFVDGEKKPYNVDNETLHELFTIFDRDGNGFICRMEFPVCYNEWIKPIANPVSVLVVVDVQNDFIDGTLALRNSPAGQDGLEVIEPIHKMQDSIHFKQVFYTKDWHPANHISFIENVELRSLHESSKIKNPKDAKVLDTVVFKGDSGQPVEQRLWPRHCVQNTSGADLHPTLKTLPGSKDVFKGMQPDLDSYSAFMDNDKKSLTKLKEYVDEVGAKDVYVCGLAYDVCVGATALDSISLGYRTVLVEDASRGVDKEGIEKTKRDVVQANGVIAQSSEVKAMVEGMDRRPELGVHLARVLKKKWEDGGDAKESHMKEEASPEPTG